MTDGNRKSGDTSGLLGDLESIRTLLEQPGDGDSGQAPDPGGGPPAEDSGRRDDDVPLLEDVVHGGVSLNETFLGGQGDFEIDAGDTVTLSAPRTGIRSYLAVRGGFRVPPGLGGSCATFTREGTGGLHRDGRPLQAGDRLPCPPSLEPVPVRKVPQPWQPDYRAPLELAVIPCAQVERFPADTLARFFASEYTLTPQTDRMGARLKGPALDVLGKSVDKDRN